MSSGSWPPGPGRQPAGDRRHDLPRPRFTGILLLVSDVVLGGVAPVVVGAAAVVTITVLWFGLPLLRGERETSGRAPTE